MASLAQGAVRRPGDELDLRPEGQMTTLRRRNQTDWKRRCFLPEDWKYEAEMAGSAEGMPEIR